MRSDMRALLKICAASFVLVVALFGVLIAGALRAIPINVAIGIAAVGFLAGVVVIGQVFGRGLTGRDRRRPEPAPDVDE